MCASAVVAVCGGAGVAHAAWSVVPGEFTHTQSLANGVLTVKVTNTTPFNAGCPLSIYKGRDFAAVQGLAETVNAYYGGTATTADISAVRAKVSEEPVSSAQFTDLLRRSDRGGRHRYCDVEFRTIRYVVLGYQNRAASDDQGTVIWGTQAYLVSGSGASAGNVGTGSLGSLLPGA
ncbi:hypothetical protein QSJ19_24540 [Gordonia sp. ABSL11-1]|uniref:hypothetical protein n=1 Tax=Gordonia sp. ABSL11-1 TaxID=3053924 RepID=UPI0025735B1A|nr:hypothetical protein [Gordonia sp. ABSL11-1]MDL9948695.1 hypothetical protein [Gordonia sp. ABSL11-1]